jgi:hypothetical protein
MRMQFSVGSAGLSPLGRELRPGVRVNHPASGGVLTFLWTEMSAVQSADSGPPRFLQNQNVMQMSQVFEQKDTEETEVQFLRYLRYLL